MATRYTYNDLSVNGSIPAGVTVNNTPCYRFQVNGKDCIHRFDSTTVQKSITVYVQRVSNVYIDTLQGELFEWDDDDDYGYGVNCSAYFRGEVAFNAWTSDPSVTVTDLQARGIMYYKTNDNVFFNGNIASFKSIGTGVKATFPRTKLSFNSSGDYTYKEEDWVTNWFGCRPGFNTKTEYTLRAILSNGSTIDFEKLYNQYVSVPWFEQVQLKFNLAKSPAKFSSIGEAVSKGYFSATEGFIGVSISNLVDDFKPEPNISADGNSAVITFQKTQAITQTVNVPGGEVQIY